MKTILETKKAVSAWIKSEATAEDKLFNLIDGIASGIYELDNVHKSIVNVIKEGVTGEAASKVRRFKTLLDLAKRARDKGVIVEPAFKAGNFGAITKELKLLMAVQAPKELKDTKEAPKELKDTKEAPKELKDTKEAPKELKDTKEASKELQELMDTLESLRAKAPLLPSKQLKAINNTLKKYL